MNFNSFNQGNQPNGQNYQFVLPFMNLLRQIHKRKKFNGISSQGLQFPMNANGQLFQSSNRQNSQSFQIAMINNLQLSQQLMPNQNQNQYIIQNQITYHPNGNQLLSINQSCQAQNIYNLNNNNYVMINNKIGAQGAQDLCYSLACCYKLQSLDLNFRQIF
ncbi:hypothetical protein TTHERM_00733930 (macronuclear) [Tetrahymena thermophila SB210]|uniref:Uncharacterized protein n=1 Tax=Tetrahymena thermophila (strain SB210) TaxID=312017 RepID=Q232A4_TETTS|nr:hypothetical protein TTHERM_00733930 [Tetrahymena thermophila SB210]EAR91296.1 hypothetical protein TTHERM_00733930 [Tetrahymena thermophila SB210]|eukprot:XP_001011541.1 hypothetical protein TTHERM_00733930 [Tetrahymena thermophila SB210]